MSKSLLQAVNQSPQSVEANGIISLGSVQRRFGQNIRLSGNGIEVIGAGYYTIAATVTASPSAAGVAEAGLYVNGNQIPGAVSAGQASAENDLVPLSLIATIRQGCCCDSADNLTLVLKQGAGTIQNVALLVEKA